jgi:hypothetical protein
MTRLGTFVTSTLVVAAFTGSAATASGQAPRAGPREELRPIAAALGGSVEGVVVDGVGAPVRGATVSALGVTSALAITDRTGRFALRTLPAGPYLVRVHSVGYVSSRRQFVEVRPSGRTTISVSLQRANRPPLLAAGLGPLAQAGDDRIDDQTELAWRLRHKPRSVLKDRTDRPGVVAAEADRSGADRSGGFARTLNASAHSAFAFFDGFPVTGQVNLLTSGSFDTVKRLFSSDALDHGVAALSLHGPVGSWADWAFQGIASQGALGSWYLSGTLKSRASGAHVYDVNVAYSAQRLSSPGVGQFTVPGVDDTRAVGSVYGQDRWKVAPRLVVTSAGRYSRYDYLGGAGLFSPRAEVSLEPFDGLYVRTAVSRHVLAPGAEEFLPPVVPGLWVPSERTFERLSTATPLTSEHTRTYEMAVDRQFGALFAVTARTFFQHVDNQLVALFSLPAATTGLGPAGSRYRVGTVGHLNARGWGVSVASAAIKYVRGSVTYQMTTADWNPAGDAAIVGLIAPSVTRSMRERIHDITTLVETEVPRTSTRVYLLYKLDTGFAKAHPGEASSGFDGRFDLQVSQPLRVLDFTSARWQVVFAIRNLFRESARDASVYDELLVVRPPKRIVGGLIVRF